MLGQVHLALAPGPRNTKPESGRFNRLIFFIPDLPLVFTDRIHKPLHKSSFSSVTCFARTTTCYRYLHLVKLESSTWQAFSKCQQEVQWQKKENILWRDGSGVLAEGFISCKTPQRAFHNQRSKKIICTDL